MSKFLCDRMLGKLATWLRLFGYDTLYAGDINIDYDEDYFLINEFRERILLTRDKELYKRAKDLRPVFLIKSDRLEEQLKELKSLGIKFELRMDRCSVCNGILRKPTREEALEVMRREGIREDLMKRFELWYCERCKKLYWMGGHWRNMKKFLEEHGLDC